MLDARTSEMVQRLRQRLRTVVGSAIGAPAGPIALIDYPNHTNAGDHAIWLGERALLEELGHEVGYVADHEAYSAQLLRRRIGRGTIVLHGGGNFGDVWGWYQTFREQVLEDFPDRRVVVLPQTVQFSDPAAAAESARKFAAHPDCVVIARDERSLERLRAGFPTVETACAPDSALMLDLGHLRRAPDLPLVWLSRTDRERMTSGPAGDLGVEPVDWIGEARGQAGWTERYQRLHELTYDWGRRVGKYPPLQPVVYPAVAYGYDALSRERLRTGTGLLGRGRRVITDRLHAHILSTLLGIPHVVVDTGYGKIDQFIRSWTAETPLLTRAPDWAAAASGL